MAHKCTVVDSPAHFNFFGSVSISPAWDEGRGLSYTPCLLMKPVLRLRLHATQSQPCFPAASNVLALPVGNGIFTATPIERITHYTLQAKSCAKGVPFGNPVLSVCSHTSSKTQNKRLQSAVKITAGLTAYFVSARQFSLSYP